MAFAAARPDPREEDLPGKGYRVRRLAKRG